MSRSRRERLPDLGRGLACAVFGGLSGTALFAAVATGGVAAVAASGASAETGLREPASFDSIADATERSVALYAEIHKVLVHPRCINCHPKDDMPRQGDDLAMHQPPVVRGAGGLGAPGMRCGTCHGEDNVDYVASDGSMPGHSPWQLAPASMGWIGVSAAAICEQIKDPARNGGKSLEELHEHNAHDGLVGWGWEPGEGREPAPGSQAIFGALTRAWIDTGAHCPQ